MGKQIAFKIVKARKVSFAPMSCDVAIGYTADDGKFVGLFTIPDFILKKKNDGSGYYYQSPSKPDIRNGEQQVDDKGYKKYLEFFRLYAEPGENKEYAVTSEAFEARKYLIGLMVEAYNNLGGEAAPAAKPKAKRTPPAAKPAEAKAEIEENEVGSPTDDDEDSGWPF